MANPCPGRKASMLRQQKGMNPMSAYTPNEKILYVDDEQSMLLCFDVLMRSENIQARTLADSQQIERVLVDEGPFAVVLSDQHMPVVDGASVLKRVAQFHPQTIRILVTGYASPEDTIRAINIAKISRYIVKPWRDEELVTLIQEEVHAHNLDAENRFLLSQVQQVNAELKDLVDGSLVGTVRILSDLLANISPEAMAQVDRVRRMGKATLTSLSDLTDLMRWEIERALDLFNLGIAVLPEWTQAVFKKEGLRALQGSQLTRQHLLAASLLENIPRFEGVARIIRLQERNFDGSGGPTEDPCRGQDIPLGARLLHILLDLDRSTVGKDGAHRVIARMCNQPQKYDVQLIRRLLGPKD